MAITYAPSVNFGAKDSLPSNDPSKVIKGSEFSVEFTAIQTAFSLAAPNASPTFTGTVTIPTADINGGNIDGTVIGAATPAAGSFTTGQFGTSLNVDGTVTADGLTVDGSFETNGDIEISYAGQNTDPTGARYLIFNNTDDTLVAGQPLGGLSWVNNDASATAGEAAYIKAYATTNTGRAELRFGTGDQSSPAEAMRIDANGNVGIGTISPTQKLHLVGSGDTMMLVNDGTYNSFFGTISGQTRVSNDNTIPIVFATNSTERMRIDSSGNLLVGKTSADFNNSTRGNVEISGSGSAILALEAGSTNDYIFNDGTNFEILAGSGQGIRFYTNGSNERARIDSSGALLVGTTSAAATAGIGTKIIPNTDAPYISTVGTFSTNSAYGYYLYSTGAGAFRCYIGYGGTIYATSTSITAISDASLKENVRDLDKGLDTILALKPRRFDWKNGDGNDIMGFVAQEVEEVLPELVHDYQYNETETKLGLKMGDMLPSLVKAIQEQQEIINDLRARVAQLEGA